MRLDGIKRLINPGVMRHQITWQQPVSGARSASGQATVTWADVYTTKATVMALTGRELDLSSRIWADARYSVIQHSRRTMDTTYRGLWWLDGVAHYLQVLDIQDRDGTGRWQTVICREME